jgi:hypothetical protein
MNRVAVPILFALFPVPALAMDRAPELAAMLKTAAPYRPGAGDFSWREIPWYDEPAAALKQARDEKRPLFVWLAGGRDRDGSPLERC